MTSSIIGKEEREGNGEGRERGKGGKKESSSELLFLYKYLLVDSSRSTHTCCDAEAESFCDPCWGKNTGLSAAEGENAAGAAAKDSGGSM